MNIQAKRHIYESGQQDERECLTKIKSKWRHDAYSSQATREDSRIVKRYLEYFLIEKKEPLSTFLPYFQKFELQLIEKQARFLAGQEVKMEEHEYTQFEELARTVEIEFLPTNKTEFGADQPVHLDLRLKNVAQLLVRVFEINSENYYRQHLAAFRSDLNLEGLLPAQERVFTYDQAPQRVHLEAFDFPELTHSRGLFVIEFIGNGFSSRAIIKKGSLTLLHQPTIAGHIAYVIDESRRICRPAPSPAPPTGLFLQGKFYEADPHTGKIVIPYAPPGRQATAKAVVSHAGLAALTDFTRLAETYSLQTAFLMSDEAFVVGNKAKLLVRPALYLNFRQADLRLLKNVVITISTFNSIDSVPTTKRFENIEFSPSSPEFTAEFQVPSKLDYISVELKAEITPASGSDKIRLSSSMRKDVNLTHQSAVHFVEAYLRKNSQGAYEVSVLGKNGEPQTGHQVFITVKHAFFDTAQTAACQTDQWGSVLLGSLDNVDWLSVRVPSSATRIEVNRKWVLPRPLAFQLPSVVELLEKETIELPMLLTGLSRDSLSFTRVNQANEPLSDEYASLQLVPSKGYSLLRLANLKQGVYLLTIKPTSQQIKVNVHRGTPWEDDSFIMTPFLLRERQSHILPLALHSLSIKGDDVELEVANSTPDTSVHLLALHFLPFSIETLFEDLAKLPPNKTLSAVHFSVWRNFFLSCRKLSDEFRYVLDRAHVPPGAANFLEKPTLLLKRLELGATSFDSNQLAQGAQIEQQFENLTAQAMLSAPNAPLLRAATAFGHFEKTCAKINFLQQFLAVPAVQEFSLQPDKNGKVKATLPGLDNYSTLVVLAVNRNTAVQKVESLPRKRLPQRDLSLKKTFEEGKAYTEVRTAKALLKHDSQIIDDITSTELSMLDSLESVHQALKELCRVGSCGSGDLEELSFLKGWDRLKKSDKLSKFAGFGCHEMNLFLKMKDPTFFEEIVRDFLLNKMEKSFMDQWLLDDESALKKYAENTALRESLNPLELVLLTAYLGKSGDDKGAKAVAGLLRRRAEANQPNVNQRNKCFDCILKLNELKKPE